MMPERRVLVVDDEPAMWRIIEVTLKLTAQVEVEKVFRGDRAVDLLQVDRSFDLIFLDLMMPGLNGFEVLEWIRERDELSQIPVVILSARGEASDRERARQLGATGYMTKPFSPREMNQRVAEIWAGSEPVS